MNVVDRAFLVGRKVRREIEVSEKLRLFLCDDPSEPAVLLTNYGADRHCHPLSENEADALREALADTT